MGSVSVGSQNPSVFFLCICPVVSFRGKEMADRWTYPCLHAGSGSYILPWCHKSTFAKPAAQTLYSNKSGRGSQTTWSTCIGNCVTFVLYRNLNGTLVYDFVWNYTYFQRRIHSLPPFLNRIFRNILHGKTSTSPPSWRCSKNFNLYRSLTPSFSASFLSWSPVCTRSAPRWTVIRTNFISLYLWWSTTPRVWKT